MNLEKKYKSDEWIITTIPYANEIVNTVEAFQNLLVGSPPSL